jgi:putative PIN family toxin of toxin-antitoxin system
VTTQQERAELIGLIRKSCLVLEPKQRRNLSRDPDDNPLIDLAIEAKARYMVTGDEDVLLVKN